MKGPITCLLLVWSIFINAQNREYVYRNPLDSSYNSYLKIWPDGKLKGIIIRDFSSLPDTNRKSPYQFGKLALNQGFMVLYCNTSNYFPELFYDDKGPEIIDEILHELMLKHSIPKENIFIGGISASGTRALRYAQYCNQGKSKYKYKIKGVFVVDSPLDNERFYKSAKNNGHKFFGGMEEEAKMMLKCFPEKLGGSPDEFPESYLQSSVYSQTDSSGANIIHFKDQSILIFHEPDMEWWMNERGASYYDINSYDLVGFARDLIFLGNKEIEIISTSGKGFRRGERNCHSWTIVDEDYLFQWISERLD